MCGFVGFTGTFDNKETVLNSMMNRIIHRGPDAAGVYTDDFVSLGFRRLSIIDLSDSATAPVFNEDRSICVMLNGEIYNYKQLREELTRNNHIFRTEGDTETLVHLYEELGAEMLSRLRGMFAFVIYDKNKETLFFARDFFGIKPMYYAEIDGKLLFASEIKALLEHPGFTPIFNEDALPHYLSFQYSVLPETFFKGVYRLMPGHYMLYKTNKLTLERYFEPVFEPSSTEQPDMAEQINEAVLESVRAHLVADVPLGSFLSSGVDSSYIAVAAGVDKTFTVGFAFDDYNEITYAQKLTEWNKKQKGKEAFVNIPHTITDTEYWQAIPKIQYHMDEPLADPSAIALYFVSREAAKHVKVALSGEAADEFFGGYNIYKEPIDLKPFKKLPLSLRKGLAHAANAVPFTFKGKNFLRRAARPLEERYIGNACIFTKKERELILLKDNAPPPSAVVSRLYKNVKNADDTTKMQYIDVNTWLAGDILLKADRMSMAHSLEVRVPYLDKHVFELASKLALKHKVSKKGTKLAFREAAKKHIPAFAGDKKKLGFPVPIRVWLRQDKYYKIIETAFKSEPAKKYFNQDELLKLLILHKNKKRDNSRKIWTLYMFLVWYNEFFKP